MADTYKKEMIERILYYCQYKDDYSLIEDLLEKIDQKEILEEAEKHDGSLYPIEDY